MPIPEEMRLHAEEVLDAYCRDAVPLHVQDKVRVGYLAKGMAITLFESRPDWKDPSQWRAHDVARFRYNKSAGHWSLYWLDRNLKWHIYDLVEPTPDFGALLKEVLDDPTHIFWG